MKNILLILINPKRNHIIPVPQNYNTQFTLTY